MRVGMGYDVHKLVKDRKLIIGGVEIPYELGLLGHSDADVLLHAIMDALLGAAALGDIGKHFPDTDDRYKGISSIRLLEEVSRRFGKERMVISISDLREFTENQDLIEKYADRVLALDTVQDEIAEISSVSIILHTDESKKEKKNNG